MRHVILGLAVLLFAVGTISAKDEKVAVKQIDLGDFRGEMPKGNWDTPTVITNADELANAVTDKKIQAKITKDVDFGTQKLLYFAWSGSSGDVLTVTEEKGTVVFSYSPGMTDDVFQHYKLYAVPKDAKVAFSKK